MPSRSEILKIFAPRAATMAAPNAESSASFDDLISFPLRSDISCIKYGFRTPPPSAFKVFIAIEDLEKSSRTSFICAAVERKAAAAKSARLLPRVNPVIMACAWRSHQGAPKPLNAGTNCTSWVDSSASFASSSGAISNNSANHNNDDPVERILASTALVIFPETDQAIV